MITASLGSHRFEAGPTYYFNNSNVETLSNVILDPAPTVDYVNTLPGVDATPEEIRQVAASGVMRLAIQGAEFRSIPSTSRILLDVCSGDDGIQESDFRDKQNPAGGFLFSGKRLSNAYLDSASVLATRKNDAEETANIIQQKIPTDEGYLVIGIANGGIISAAHTFLQLGEGNHALSFASYSRHKRKEKEPNMYPYPSERASWLRNMAQNREVVVYDEDYASRETISTAVKFFAGMLESKVHGIVPVNVGRRITYSPLVITSE